ncbi:hypothetical protein P7C70_g4543, partial [Phenoliferia sp. Uapishka_3]
MSASHPTHSPSTRFRLALLAPTSSLSHLQRLASKLPDIRNTDPQTRQTSLALAIGANRYDVAQWLIEEGHEEGEISRDTLGETCLHIAAARGFPDLLELYLSQYSFVLDWVNSRGATPLHTAAMKGEIECATVLIENGAELDVPDLQGNTPIHYASSWGHLPVVKLLIDMDCQHGAKNNDDFTAADYAFRYAKSIDHSFSMGLTPIHAFLSFAGLKALEDYARAHFEATKRQRQRKHSRAPRPDTGATSNSPTSSRPRTPLLPDTPDDAFLNLPPPPIQAGSTLPVPTAPKLYRSPSSDISNVESELQGREIGPRMTSFQTVSSQSSAPPPARSASFTPSSNTAPTSTAINRSRSESGTSLVSNASSHGSGPTLPPAAHTVRSRSGSNLSEASRASSGGTGNGMEGGMKPLMQMHAGNSSGAVWSGPNTSSSVLPRPPASAASTNSTYPSSSSHTSLSIPPPPITYHSSPIPNPKNLTLQINPSLPPPFPSSAYSNPATSPPPPPPPSPGTKPKQPIPSPSLSMSKNQVPPSSPLLPSPKPPSSPNIGSSSKMSRSSTKEGIRKEKEEKKREKEKEKE